MSMLSDIKSISIKDFRCLKEITIDFTESPIICLQAGNDSGKSSVVKAIESTIYNSNNSVSKGFIRTGSTGFKIRLELMDGNIIERERGTIGNVYRLTGPDGVVVCEHSKLDKGDVPPQIAQLLNVFCDETTGELLNIRTCESLLIFALTTGSENYKIMHTGLKVDQVSNAINLGKTRVNQLKNAIDNSNYAIAEYNKQIRSLQIPDLTPVEQLKERIAANGEKASKLKNIIADKYNIASMKSGLTTDTQKLLTLSEIDETKIVLLDTLRQATELKKTVESIKCEHDDLAGKLPEEISDKNVELISNISETIKLLNELKDNKSKLSGMTRELPEELNEETIKLFTEALDIIKAINEERVAADSELKAIEELEDTMKSELSQVQLVYLEDENAIRYKCKNCGEEDVISLEGIERACSDAVNG